MAEITHNKANKKTGKPMSAVGQRASFLKYFGDAVKGTAVEGLSPLVETRTSGWHVAWAGGNTLIHVAKLGNDLYRVSWHRPKGRTGEAEGTQVVERQVTVRCAEDLGAYLADIENQNSIDVEPLKD